MRQFWLVHGLDHRVHHITDKDILASPMGILTDKTLAASQGVLNEQPYQARCDSTGTITACDTKRDHVNTMTQKIGVDQGISRGFGRTVDA